MNINTVKTDKAGAGEIWQVGRGSGCIEDTRGGFEGIVPNCKMHGINPEEYLKDVLGRLPNINRRGVGTHPSQVAGGTDVGLA